MYSMLPSLYMYIRQVKFCLELTFCIEKFFTFQVSEYTDFSIMLCTIVKI